MKWRSSRLILTLLAFGLLIAGSVHSFAQTPGVYRVIVEKQEEKKRSRWTIADWLARKKEMRLMDLWLAKNSYSSPYEFYLSGSRLNYNVRKSATPSVRENFNGHNAELAAYAGRVGLRAAYADDEESRQGWSGGLNFRVYGQSIQDTHINLQWGLRGLKTPGPESEKFQNQFGAVDLNLYLTRNFGLGGQYLRLLPARSNLENSLEGEEIRGKVFVDFSAVQIFGEWKQERLTTRTPNGSERETRSGYGGGLRFFF